MEVDELCDGTVRGVLSRNPFWISEREWPRTNQECKMGMLDAMRYVGRIDIKCHARRRRDGKWRYRQHHETQGNQCRFVPASPRSQGGKSRRKIYVGGFATD